MSTGDANLDADIVSEYQRPVPEGFDRFAAIPSWPGWQFDSFVDRIDGSVFRSYWAKFDGRVYRLAQFPTPFRGSAPSIPAGIKPQIELCVVEGTPKPWNPDWTLRKLVAYPLPGIDPTKEARGEIAT